MRWRRVAVRGPSMSPALHDGDVVLVRFAAPVRPGDVVLVRWPARPGQLSVKRAARAVDGGWWVAGDNPFGSTDSRELGPAEVVAVVRARLWPRPGRDPTRARRTERTPTARPGSIRSVPDSPTSAGPRHPAATPGGAVRHRVRLTPASLRCTGERPLE